MQQQRGGCQGRAAGSCPARRAWWRRRCSRQGRQCAEKYIAVPVCKKRGSQGKRVLGASERCIAAATAAKRGRRPGLELARALRRQKAEPQRPPDCQHTHKHPEHTAVMAEAGQQPKARHVGSRELGWSCAPATAPPRGLPCTLEVSGSAQGAAATRGAASPPPPPAGARKRQGADCGILRLASHTRIPPLFYSRRNPCRCWRRVRACRLAPALTGMFEACLAELNRSGRHRSLAPPLVRSAPPPLACSRERRAAPQGAGRAGAQEPAQERGGRPHR